LSVLADERLVRINSMGTQTCKVDDMEKLLEELDFMRDFEEVRGECKR